MKKSTFVWVVSVTLIAVNLVFYLFKPGGERILLYVSDGLPILCSFIAIFGLYKAFSGLRLLDLTKRAWLMIMLGMVFFSVAEIVYAFLEVGFGYDMNDAFPTVADIFWCLGYVPLIAGLAMMLVQYKRSGFPMGNVKAYSIISVVVAILVMIILVFILVPIVNDEETGALAKVFYLYYPLADVLVLMPAAFIIYITSLFGANSISKPWRYLGVGFLCFTVADIVYSFLSWQDIYSSGNLTDLAWHSGYLLIGLAGFYQREVLESFKTE